jgi:hypothetical protein
MATKAELEKQLAEAQEQLKGREELGLFRPKEEINIEDAIEFLGVSLVSLGGTKDKKIQAIQADIRTLTITLAKLASGGKVEFAAAAPKQG